MKVLVTAGVTRVMIDKVRCITSIFTGRTGDWIAKYFFNQGDEVVLITSNKQQQNFRIIYYKTFDELFDTMKQEIVFGEYDIIIHSAAVSDFKVSEVHDDKIFSNQALTLKMIPTLKIIDMIREPWGFEGILVKFKLQVGNTDKELTDISYKSLLHSDADLIVANDLEQQNQNIIINKQGAAIKIYKRRLAEELYGRTRNG